MDVLPAHYYYNKNSFELQTPCRGSQGPQRFMYHTVRTVVQSIPTLPHSHLLIKDIKMLVVYQGKFKLLEYRELHFKPCLILPYSRLLFSWFHVFPKSSCLGMRFKLDFTLFIKNSVFKEVLKKLALAQYEPCDVVK